MSHQSSVVLDDLSFHWPDGDHVLSHVTGAFGVGRTGLVGANGSGKTTLLRLIAGELEPTTGSIVTSGEVDVLRQDVTRGRATVADLLGITKARGALRAIEGGSVAPEHFDAIGQAWDVEERAVASLASADLPTDLDRTVATLSGGEAVLTSLIGIRLRAAEIALLDEPTNNLDLDSRERLYDVVRDWRGTLIVVSHDLELLDLLDATTELRASDVTTFGGPYSEYRAWLDSQQVAALQALRSAEQVLRREHRERIKAEQRIAHSQREGLRDRDNRKFVPAAIDRRRNSAEKAQGSRRSAADARLDDARASVTVAERAVREDAAIRLDLPDPGVPNGRRIVELPAGDGRAVVIRGPERVGLVGPNGVGKTTMLEDLLPDVLVHVGYVPQRLVLDDAASVLDLLRRAAPDVPPAELRNRLARLLIRGPMVDRPVGALSGGERFRVALAQIVLAEPPPQLLVLDEPTNDLDIASTDQLVSALASYRGALLVVSHDRRFLARLGLDRVVRLDARGRLEEVSLSGWL